MNAIYLLGRNLMETHLKLFGLLWLSTILGLIASSASAQDADRGHELAARWCSGCHAIDKNGANRTEAPSFSRIAAKHGDDQKWLRAWLMTPHPSMPDMNLSRREIDDVVAYLKTVPKSE